MAINIKNLPNAVNINNEDYIIIEQTTGTKKATISSISSQQNTELVKKVDTIENNITDIQKNIVEHSSQLDTITQKSIVNCFSLLNNKECNIIFTGDSLSVGYSLNGNYELDGLKVPIGRKSFANEIYYNMLLKTCKYIPCDDDYFELTNYTDKDSGFYNENNFNINSVINFLGRKTFSCFGSSGYDVVTRDDVSLSFDYSDNDLYFWMLSSTNGGTCDIFIDGEYVGEMSNISLSNNEIITKKITILKDKYNVKLTNFKGKGAFEFYLMGISNRKHDMVNCGYGGKDVVWANDNFTRFENRNADIIFLNWGANDVLLDVNVFEEKYDLLYKRLKTLYPNAIYYTWTSVPDSNQLASNYENEHLRIIKKLSYKYNSTLCDTWHYMKNIDKSLWCVDNIHMNEYGNKIIKECYNSTISPELNVSCKNEKNTNIKLDKILDSNVSRGACIIRDESGFRTPKNEQELKCIIGTIRNHNPDINTNAKVITNGVGFALVKGGCSKGDIICGDINGWCKADNEATTNIIGYALENINSDSIGKIYIQIK